MSEIKEAQSPFGYGWNGDEFKPLTEVLLSDARQRAWVIARGDGATRVIQLEDLHKWMSELNLNSTVSEDVRTGFDTARNLFLYSWFVYRFRTVAELQAYAILEFALGERMEAEGVKNIKNLSQRLNYAVEKGWLRADGIKVYQRNAESRKRYAEEQAEFFEKFLQHEKESKNVALRTEEDYASDYLRGLTDAIPKIRNTVAHGNPYLNTGSALTLEICCDLINQLFP